MRAGLISHGGTNLYIDKKLKASTATVTEDEHVHVSGIDKKRRRNASLEVTSRLNCNESYHLFHASFAYVIGAVKTRKLGKLECFVLLLTRLHVSSMSQKV